MMKRSAGILVYRMYNQEIQVLLCHMGGPYWQGLDEGAWSIPKGEVESGSVLENASREFQEETGFSIDPLQLRFLGSRKQSNRKLVIVFTLEEDFDATKAKSNSFSLEWPKGSGVIQEFPEMDKAFWFSLSVAKSKILPGQVYFLRKLEEELTYKGCAIE